MIDMWDKTTYTWNAVANYRTATVIEEQQQHHNPVTRSTETTTITVAEAATLLKRTLISLMDNGEAKEEDKVKTAAVKQ